MPAQEEATALPGADAKGDKGKKGDQGKTGKKGEWKTGKGKGTDWSKDGGAKTKAPEYHPEDKATQTYNECKKRKGTNDKVPCLKHIIEGKCNSCTVIFCLLALLLCNYS